MTKVFMTKTFKDLEQCTVEMALKAGFKFKDKYYYLLSSLSHKKDFKYEPIFIFKK